MTGLLVGLALSMAVPAPQGASGGLTRAGVALAAAGLTLLSLGIGLANVELLLLGAFPLLLLAATLAERAGAAAPTASLELSTRAPKRGDAVDAVLRVEAPAGHDLVEVHAALPDSFSLDSGTNLLLRAGRGRGVGAFRARPHARGHHELGPLRAESVDAAGLAAPRAYDVAPAVGVDVAPRVHRRVRYRGRLRTRGRHAAATSDDSRLGARSTDFRELRDYHWGDPQSAIHWKATAKRLSARSREQQRGVVPVVSEYEREGRRAVFVLLDGGDALRVGTSQATGLDSAVEGALTLTSFFLEGGARVGAATFGASAGPPAYPESGAGRFAALERALDPGSPDPARSLTQAVERVHGHLAGAAPLLVVLTRITPQTSAGLVEAARRLRALLRERRRELPLLVVDVRALGLAPAPTPAWEAARRLVELQDAAAAADVRAAGARVIAWAPEKEDLLQVLLSKGVAR